MTPSQEAREYPLPESLVIEAAKSCGLECDRLSQLFDFTERVVRMARTPMLSADGGEDIPLSRSYVDADRKARQQEALDARRYRWLVETLGDHMHGLPSLYLAYDDDIGDYRPASFFGIKAETVDAKIDAAIAKGEQSHE